MLPEIRLACLWMSGAFLCRQTKSPPRWGRNLERAKAKAEPSHSIPIYRTPPVFAIRGDYAAAPRSVPMLTVFNNVPCSSQNSTTSFAARKIAQPPS